MSGTISFSVDNPDYLAGKYNAWTMVGTAAHVPLSRRFGVESITVVDPANTCLKPDGSGVTSRVIEGRRYVNLGACRLDKGHDGPCSSEVFYCDGPCNGTYPEDHPHVGNQDVTICEECNKPYG